MTYMTIAAAQGAFKTVTVSERTAQAFADGSWILALVYIAAALAGLGALLATLQRRTFRGEL